MGAAVTTAALSFLGLLGGAGPFGQMHVLYFAFVVTVPLVAVGTLVTARRSLRAPLVVAAGCCLLPVPFGIYATHIEPGWLRVDRLAAQIPDGRAGDGAVRLGVVSDLQMATVGDHERRAVRALVDERPDVILVPGDLFQMDDERFEQQLPALRELYSELRAPHGVFVVPGDTDGTDRLRRVLDGTGITLLVDEVAEVDVRGRQLLIGGIDLAYDGAGADAVRERLLLEPPAGALTVQLAHRPDAVLELPPASRVDLTVSGHTHGGQIVLPLVGPLMTLSEVPRAVARGGLHEVDGNQIYVSAGVGAERGGAPQIRFLDRPSVALLELE